MRKELESVVLTLTEATADHYLALSGIIAALSPGYLEKALDYSRVANTERRRDSILVDIVRALLRRPVAEIDVKDLRRVLSIVSTAESRDEVLELVMRRFEDEAATTRTQIDDLLPIVSSLPDIEDSVTACRALVHAIKVLHRAQDRDSLKEHILANLRKRWSQIDMIWARIDTGFGVAADLASISVADANEILTETEALKSEWRIAGQRQASAYVTCINLSIRAFCGLLPRHLEKDTDIEALAALIEILPSYGERSVLWADLCLRSALAERLDLTERLVERYLQPAFANLSKQDVAYRKRVLVHIAPALYRAQPSTCLEEIDTLDPDSRDAALRQIIRFLLFERAPSDSVDSSSVLAVKTSYETLLTVESLAQRLTTDWMIYVTAQEVADALQSSENRYTVNMPQREDMARRFSLIAEQKLPIARQINHPGYRIITLAQALRMRQAKPLEWKQVIEAAKSVGNVFRSCLCAASDCALSTEEHGGAEERVAEHGLQFDCFDPVGAGPKRPLHRIGGGFARCGRQSLSANADASHLLHE